MATKVTNISTYRAKNKKKRKGVHAKCKSSKLKGSKNYIKLSIGQN